MSGNGVSMVTVTTYWNVLLWFLSEAIGFHRHEKLTVHITTVFHLTNSSFSYNSNQGLHSNNTNTFDSEFVDNFLSCLSMVSMSILFLRFIFVRIEATVGYLWKGPFPSTPLPLFMFCLSFAGNMCKQAQLFHSHWKVMSSHSILRQSFLSLYYFLIACTKTILASPPLPLHTSVEFVVHILNLILFSMRFFRLDQTLLSSLCIFCYILRCRLCNGL